MSSYDKKNNNNNEPTAEPADLEMVSKEHHQSSSGVHDAPATKAVNIPEKKPSSLGTFPGADEKPSKSKSWLQRHGLSLAGGNAMAETVDRSPVGAVRISSGITNMKIDTNKVKEELAKKQVEEAKSGIPWHSFNLDELKEALKMSAAPDQGLSSTEHQARVAEYGLNQITAKEAVPLWMRFLKNLVGGFQLMMFVGGILCFVVFGISPTDLQTLTLGISLFAVVLITCIFQTYQEGKGDNVMEALRAQLADKVHCLRDGKWQAVDATELVPGDYIEVQSGEKVPADMRVVWSSDLKVNNASLTGENVDIKLGPDANHTDIFEAKNIARSGCNFTSGKGRGIVFATGDNTFFGQIAFATTQTERPDTLMKREIHRLVLIMGAIAGTIGATFLGLSFAYGYRWDSAVTFTIGIIVACVPEGLLPQLTVALAITAKKLMAKDVLITNLEIIETLGAVTVICSDKTGTLTCNRMTVSHAAYGAEIHDTENAPHCEGDTFTRCNAEHQPFKLLLRCANLCSDAIFTDRSDADILKWVAKGDASESAIVKFVQGFQDLEEFRAKNARVCAIPFNSTNKYMLSINNIGGTEHLLTMKGAPERIFDRCAWFINPAGQKVKFDKDARKTFEELNTTLGKRGERVIAFAELPLTSAEYGEDYPFDAESEIPNFPMEGLTLVGLISMIDPPRATVPAAIKACFAAGIQVFMVTGDHPVTALAISKSLGLVTGKTLEELKEAGEPLPEDGVADAIVIHGIDDLPKFEQKDWDHVLKHKQIVFARTQPQQKQDIVRQLAKKGHIVAMTGDGVNDAPALKAAHVGVAMGSGAQVAKEAAQIVVLKDDFASIVDGVREGRNIFENMKKAIIYVLISNVPQLIPFLIFIANKVPLAIETLTIIVICVGTDIAPAIALAHEEPEGATLLRKPRGPDEHLVTAFGIIQAYGTLGIFQTVAMLFAFFYVFNDAGYPLSTLVGAGPKYRASAADISADQEIWFRNFCNSNPDFIAMGKNASVFDECRDYRLDILERAQGAAFLTCILGQLGNIITKKTSIETSFTFDRLFRNANMFFSICIMFFIATMVLYVPGLNKGFGLSGPSALHGAVGLFIIPWFIIWEETRKWLIRRNPEGFFAKCSRW